ncbi:MAG: hypothetical protein E7D48_04185 [Bifidobacterium scardovii]|jgi:hypothetical protein|uniref:hypothetical protein n=1 Tax=Bifidobacterium scardovii TaxID=158787 RepID=UPI0028FF632D|nr:hypothetical protein [Bifidobacterium scardovii]MDU2421300.1 hypothetical protein [Bifidobacterium scardovii]
MLNPEQAVIDWLNRSPDLADCPASLSVPAERPDRFITVERTGGADTDIDSTPTIAVQVWTPNRWEASDLATRIVRPLLLGLDMLDPIAKTEIQSAYNNPDPGPPQHARYQFVITLTMAAQ